MLSYVLHNLGGGFGFVMLTRVARAQPAATMGRAAPLPYFRVSLNISALCAGRL